MPDDQPSVVSGPRPSWQVALSALIYWVSVSLVPVYNKRLFSKSLYPYPVATAAMQLAMVSAALGLVSILKHLAVDGQGTGGRRRQQSQGRGSEECYEYQALGASAGDEEEDRRADRQQSQHRGEASWVMGPGYMNKLWAIAPVGLLFGIKYGITNWGLHLVPTSTHLLLQATDLLWTVLAAWLINGEKQGVTEAVACLGTVVGSMLVGMRLNQSMESPFLPLLINLLSPVLLGLCIATLRRATVLLMDPAGSLGGTAMTSVELTCHKLYLSAFSAGVCAVLIEGFDVLHSLKGRPPFWEALAESPWLLVGLAGGAFLVLIFQVNITWLSSLTNATAVGIVGGVKVVPQWLVSLLFALKVDVSAYNLGGAAIVLLSSAVWTASKLKKASSAASARRDQQSISTAPLPVLAMPLLAPHQEPAPMHVRQ